MRLKTILLNRAKCSDHFRSHSTAANAMSVYIKAPSGEKVLVVADDLNNKSFLLPNIFR